MGTPYLGLGEASFRLDRLRDSWNQLRNDALGRGLAATPVSPELAERVGRRYEAWRAWYAEQAQRLWSGPTSPFHIGSPFARELDAWTNEYAELRNEVIAERGDVGVEAPAVVPLQNVAAPPSIPSIATFVGTGLFVLGVVYVLRVTR